jgi:3-oxoadipate enol-lactonase
MSVLDVPGGRLNYEVDGSGPAVVLVHAGVAHLRMWDEQVGAWRDRFQLIRFDCRGFGQTITEDVPFSNRDDIRRLLDHVGVERASVVGASRGGSISVDFAVENPDRVGALVLVGSGLGGFEGPDDGIDWDDIDKLESEHRWDELVEREVQIWTDGISQPPDRVAPDVRRRMTEWGIENYRADQHAQKAQPLQPPAAGRLDEIAVPTLVTWGDLDVPSVAAAGEYMSTEIAGAQRHVFPGVAHMVNLERPAEFNRLVGDFLAGVSAARG